MRSPRVWSAALLLMVSGIIAACASSEEDGGDDQSQNITGGSGSVEPSVVYLFDGNGARIVPTCAGALLSERFAVTARSCAKPGLSVGRAKTDFRRSTLARVRSVRIPQVADADIAVVELDRPLSGAHAVITHTPLRDGYTVNGIAVSAGSGMFDPSNGAPSSITGRMTSETDVHASIVPEDGSQICTGDVGAPVCSSVSAKIAGVSVLGTCGLSGIVVGALDVESQPSRSRLDENAPDTTSDVAATNSCSGGAWKVAELGRYADFLRSFAPEAFQPLIIDQPLIRNFPYAPTDLWGYKTGGDITSCKLETTTLTPTAVNAESKVVAKVSYANLQERARLFGRFGIAPKSAPNLMRWLPAKATIVETSNGADATFEGVVAPDKDGEYIVAFRTSTSGGETWTSCDLDGIANGFDLSKALSLRVGAGTGGTTADPTADGGVPVTVPSAPSDTNSDIGDTAGGSDANSEVGDPSSGDSNESTSVAKKKKKKASSGGCSAAPGDSGSIVGIPAFAMLGVVALLRRRRR